MGTAQTNRSTAGAEEISIRRAKDYAWLRERGLAYLQQMTDHRWTDHNVHDPGITILEQFCYALTDLAYRADFPIADIMSEGGKSEWKTTIQARTLLPTGPINLLDWRKLLLDIPGVRNAWIKPVNTLDKTDYEPLVYYDHLDSTLRLEQAAQTTKSPLALRGLYQIEIVPEDEQDKETLKKNLYTSFHAHRNLCEDLYQIRVLEEVPIQVLGRIEIGDIPHPDGLLLKILERIHDYFSPVARFYSLQEMQERGYHLEHIMDGPKLNCGYLDEEELAKLKLRKHFRVSDIVHIIMDIEGVEAVRDLRLEAGHVSVAMKPGAKWVLGLSEGMYGRLDLSSTSPAGLQLIQNGQVYPISESELVHQFDQRIQNKLSNKQISSVEDLISPPPQGRDRQIGLHQSLVEQFPEIYGISTMGLPAGSSSKRRAQAKQLKAYLSFFDQLLSDSFARLAKAGQLLDVNNANSDIIQFGQSLEGVLPGFEGLIEAEPYHDLLREQGFSADRKKRLLQHLLARFGEYFADFDLSLFDQGEADNPRQFLKDYPNLSYERCKAMDYTLKSKAEKSRRTAVLEKRLALLLGFPMQKPEKLAALDKTAEGTFYLVEHILLRPTSEDTYQHSPMALLPFKGSADKPPQEDPYSLQLSFVFPGWLERWQDKDYWQFVLQTLRMQTPAHLKIYVHQLDQDEMEQFESAFHDWLDLLPNKNHYVQDV